MTNHNGRSGSQPQVPRDVDTPAAARATRFLLNDHPPDPNSLIRIGSVAARAAPGREPHRFAAAGRRHVQASETQASPVEAHGFVMRVTGESPSEARVTAVRVAGKSPAETRVTAVRVAGKARAEARVAAMRDAEVDIASTAARTRTSHSAASAMRAPDLRHAGMTPRRFRISFTANERLIEKLVLVTALLGEEHDEPAIDEVLEFAVDALICACRGG